MATINKRGGTWQLTWSAQGKQHRVSLGPITEAEAEVRRREKELELLTGRRYGASGITLAAFSADYLIWYARQYPSTFARTAGIINRELLPAFGLDDIDTISPAAVARWMARRQAAPATITKEARTLHAMLRRAVMWRVIREHPLAGNSPPPERASKPPDYYTQEQLAALYVASPNHDQVWRLMANTGLRRNEALYLKVEDVLSDRLIVRSLEDRPTKSRRWRDVPLNSNARAAVEALRRPGQIYLLPRIAPPSLSRAFVVCAERSGLAGSLHTLRHTFISHLVMAGVDLNTVQKMAGHSTISTTLRYAHLGPGHAAAAVEKIAL